MLLFVAGHFFLCVEQRCKKKGDRLIRLPSPTPGTDTKLITTYRVIPLRFLLSERLTDGPSYPSPLPDEAAGNGTENPLFG